MNDIDGSLFLGMVWRGTPGDGAVDAVPSREAASLWNVSIIAEIGKTVKGGEKSLTQEVGGPWRAGKIELPFTLWTDLGLPNNSFVKMHRKSST